MSQLLRLGLLGLALAACGARGEAQRDGRVRELAGRLVPRVERAVGLAFRAPPTIAVRDAAQVRAYLVQKLYEEYPADEFDRVTQAYRLFGLVPDTLDLRELLLGLYTEQVIGYYDPDSSTLYVVQGADPAFLEATLAHELVHALQGQYAPLDSLLSLRRQNDRRMAIQAVMEGQAMLATLMALSPSLDLTTMPERWRDLRDRVRRQQERMPVFSAAPLVIREGLIFPYLAGMDFMRWFATVHGDTVPYGPRLPASTEQILHPDRYQRGDGPVELAFTGRVDPLYDDNLGEFETRILLTVLTGSESVAAAGALDWGGDRYALFAAPGDTTALVWWTVWDTPRAADRFARLMAQEWQPRPAAGRRRTVDPLPVEGRSGVRLVDAPRTWDGWRRPPGVAER